MALYKFPTFVMDVFSDFEIFEAKHCHHCGMIYTVSFLFLLCLGKGGYISIALPFDRHLHDLCCKPFFHLSSQLDIDRRPPGVTNQL